MQRHESRQVRNAVERLRSTDREILLLSAWGPYEPCPPFAPADLDEDCNVGFGDLVILLANWS